MCPKQQSIFFSSVAMCLWLAAFSCRNVTPFANTLEQEVRNTLDFAQFDKSRLDDHLEVVVASQSGRRIFTKDNIEQFIAHTREKGEKYEPSGFKVLSNDESDTVRFATITYEVTWHVSIDNNTRSTHVVSHEIWERQIDGWHRLAAAMDSNTVPAEGGPKVVAQIISAHTDQTGQHPGLAAIGAPAKVTCATATSDVPKPQPQPSCNINAPGFNGDVKVGGVIGTSGAGTVTLTCNGQGNRLACSARVQ